MPRQAKRSQPAAPGPGTPVSPTHGSAGSSTGLLWRRAAAFAARAHKNQWRKDGRTPYYSHPVRVCLTVSQVFGCSDEVALCAALLHDTIEDTQTDYEDVLDAFGEDVARCVAALTKNMALPEDVREPEYDQRMLRADWQAKLVKLADALDNLDDLVNWRSENDAENFRKMISKCDRAMALLSEGPTHPTLHHAAQIVERAKQEALAGATARTKTPARAGARRRG
ncbi:MAG: bifunctional (p)ppGpp synthetase/guanosine-3',5'-bis(diphosphate) 3'-pyrophosphohydrolase [Phycisphaeraceae bacterium]|nr:bifunctional (p)ppGpp synthetase/guanosine-3',5'-bis(diphosphate) 3'-pyrophosphohydrolase [Phycisphaeraceae bacterium]